MGARIKAKRCSYSANCSTRHAPNFDWDRWIELKECAIELLDRYAPEAKSVLPKPLPREYLQPAKLKLYRV